MATNKSKYTIGGPRKGTAQALRDFADMIERSDLELQHGELSIENSYEDWTDQYSGSVARGCSGTIKLSADLTLSVRKEQSHVDH